MRAHPLSTRLDACEVVAEPQPGRHARAEALLVQALGSGDSAEADSLRDEAVLLTLDVPDQVARRYQGRGIDHDDLVQVGRLALVKAVRGYRTGFGSGFIAYALPT